MKRGRLLLVGLAVLVASAHVGSPDAWYEGSAGPYAVLIHVEVPQVIPGIATVRIRVDGASTADIERVTAFADHVDATGGAPPPERAEAVDGQPGWYRTQLWLMVTGSYSVTVAVEGAQGAGSAVVPVVAMPLSRLEFGGWLAWVLGALGLFLLTGLLTIVGASVRESVLPPGAEPDAPRRRRARWAIARAALVLTVLLVGGWRWWRSEDAAFERSRYRPLAASAAVQGGDLVLTIDDPRWAAARGASERPGVARPGSALIEDHGKLMHLFLIAEDGRAFAHLHPATDDSVRFTAARPPLPPGPYRVFADIVQESGFTQTLVASVQLPVDDAEVLAMQAAPDDSWAVAAGSTAATAALADGSSITWLSGGRPLVAGEEASLRFAVTPPTEDASPLEPYMGMAGHAAVVRDDGQVFAHLHPMGSFSMAAQMRWLSRGASATPHVMHAAAPGDTISFPYAFPEPGRYGIWVQVKRAGRVLTGRFGADVRENPSDG